MSFATIQQTFFFGLLFIVTATFIWLIRDFLFPIFWAIVFTIIFYPIHRIWLSSTKSRKSLSTLLTIFSILILFFVPLSLISSLVIKESVNYYQLLSLQTTKDDLSFLTTVPIIENALTRAGITEESLQQQTAKAFRSAANWLSSQALLFGQNTFKFIIQFFVFVYILFFMLRDGPHLENRLIEILPLGDSKERQLFHKFTSTTRATVKGTFVIAVIQGIIGGALFFIAGIKAPILWGTLMGILSIIPALGASIIWAPAGVILLLGGSIWQGALILLGGLLIVSLVDNLLRPALVGKDTQMPDVIILLSTLGGLSLFGISGFVIGPIVAAFFFAMWHMFEEQFKKELKTQG
jgi:predicted PurR-regulated permease PerM